MQLIHIYKYNTQQNNINSSVEWTDLGHIFKNPKMQKLTPAVLLFFH